MSPTQAQRQPKSLAALTKQLGTLWGLSLAGLTVVRNNRLRTTVARYLPVKRQLELSGLVANARRWRCVLVHELAHAAAVELYGRRVKPHGKEWVALVESAERAGVVPNPRRVALRKKPITSVTTRFAHTCPVCQFRRIAKRRVTTWLGPECHANGLPGDLVIEKLR